MFKLTEPNWWIVLVKNLNWWMNSSQSLIHWLPILSDVFVFTYPIFLVWLYVMWWIKRNSYYKKTALFIFSGTFLSICLNVFIQFFVDKTRPNFVLWLVDEKTESILHKFLPSSSFPSDHAAVSMWFAMATLFRWIKNRDRKIIWFGIIFFLFSLIMGFSRITIAVHWPTDIIWGMIVGLIVIIVLSNKKIFNLFDKIFEKIAVFF